ncbi:ABL030Wp [Eremothecium gossypii ATCC 10895]|uniref:ATP-dependent DNA helicase II subunit 2 n=1 Tax=Eremothecium gossypii (strain ATCC 10895 / CBS 109.51 / FGSC 9923 / NRRL Y-1056) TaxID=284811 RepID=Q75DP7_EREGS|nr:ABL030Wp [Eremothecium gossypii ATCC 10895]AAS50741.3 ABL030Wp [Eremothecium gossypii ATCC 10895]AEY95030.1 FABL030Wp [Eremothecium gossypii FDAG1]
MSQECTTFLIDYSASMLESTAKFEAYLEYALFDKAQRSRKTDYTHVVLANCAMEKNPNNVKNMFEVFAPSAPITLSSVVKICERLKAMRELDPLDTKQSNVFEALLAIGMQVNDKFNKRKMLKQVMVVTDDLDGLNVDSEDLEVVQANLDLRLILVYCAEQFPDNFSKTKWGQLLALKDGSRMFTLYEVLGTIERITHQPVKPVRVFHGQLRLGADMRNLAGCQQDPHCLCINVEGYPATKAVVSMSRKQVQKTEDGKYLPLQSVIEYEIHEPTEEDNEEYHVVPVPKEHVTKAYRYGADYVVLPELLEHERLYTTTPGLDIRGFIDTGKVLRHHLCSESVYIMADSREGTAADYVTFAALVDAMIAAEKFAIARYVQKKDSEVQMCLLCPLLVEPSTKKRPADDDAAEAKRALVLCRLPFAEDERSSDFPPLVKQEPADVMLDTTMAAFIDSMDMDAAAPPASWCSSSNVRSFDSFMKDSTLPLPDDPSLAETISDPACIPAIALHHQKHVLLEYFHQRFILRLNNGFSVADLRDSLRSKVSPWATAETSELAARIKDTCAVKLVERPPEATAGAYVDEEQDEASEVPPLEALLALGKRNP